MRWQGSLVSNVVAAMVVCMGLAGSAAYAGNPENWTFFAQTTGSDVFWSSPTTIDTGFPQYDLSYEITQVDALIDFGFSTQWVSLLNQFDPNDLAGGGSYGSLPLTLFSDSFSYSGNSATIFLGIDGNGQGQSSITAIQFGTALGFDVEGLRVGGIVNVSSIPEPAALGLLMTLAMPAMLRRRAR